MKNNICTFIMLVAIVCFCNGTNAQSKDENKYNESVIVKSSFDPVVNEAYKLSDKPRIFDSKFELPPFTYDKDTRRFPTTMTFEKIKPAKVMGEPIPILYNTHIKAGVGTYFTSLLDVTYSQTRSKDFVYSANYHHKSSLGQIKEYANSSYANNDLNLYAKKIWDGFFVDAAFQYNHQRQYYYGFSDTIDIDKKDYRASYHNVGTIINYNSLYKDADALHNSASFALNYTSSKWGRSEMDLSLGADVHKNFDFMNSEEQLLGLNMQYEHFFGKYKAGDLGVFYNDTLRLNSFDNNVGSVTVKPYVDLNIQALRLYADIEFVPLFGDEKQFKILPNVVLDMPVIAQMLKVSAGIKSRNHTLTLNELRKDNPFISPLVRIENESSIALFAKANVISVDNMLLSLEAGYEDISNKGFYQLDNKAALNNMFILMYDKAKRLYLDFNVGYHINDRFEFRTELLYQNVKTETLEHAWYVPAFKADMLLQYTAANKFTIAFRPYFQTKTKCLDENGVVQDLKAKVDINLSASYKYSDQLIFFVDLNNLAFQRYYDYYNYPSQKFVGMIGASIAF